MNQAAGYGDSQESYEIVEQTIRARRLPLIAAFLGGLGMLASFSIGLISYNYAVDKHREEHERFCLNGAKTLAAYANTLEALSDQEVILRIHRLWDQTQTEAHDEYLCVVDQNSKLLLHSLKPDTVGNYTGDNVLPAYGSRRQGCLSEVVRAQIAYVGAYISSAGQLQIAAFAPIASRGWSLGVHRSKAAMLAEIQADFRPQLIGLVAACAIFFPISLLLLYRTFSCADRGRKQAQAQLNLTQFVIDHCADQTFWINEKGRFCYVNEAACRATAYTRTQLLEMSVWDIDADFREEEWPEHWQELKQRQTLSFESRHRIKAGRCVPVEVTLNWLVFGGREYNCAFVRDITERKAAEQALYQREEQYRTLVENTPDVIMRFDRQGRHLYASPSIEQVLPFKVDEIVGKTHRELGFPVRKCQFWEHCIEQVFASGQPREEEVEIQARGAKTLFDWRLFPEFGEQGRVATVVTVAKNITEQRRAQEDYETLFREMLDGFALHEIIFDDAGRPVDYRFLAVNPAFERMTGLRADEIVGKTVQEALPGVEQHWIETYGRVALTSEPIHFENYARELGRYWEVTAFRPTQGQFACIFEDITEAKQLEEDKKKLEVQLRRSQKLETIGTLAGGIAHDFNNILTPISGYIEMAVEDLPAHSQTCKDLRRVQRATARAKDLVRKMLAFSRQMDSEPQAIKLGPIVSEVAELVECSMPTHTRLGQHIESDCAAVFADPTQIHQVLMNLCTNALYAMKDAGGQLDIRLQPTDVDADMARVHPGLVAQGYVRLTVSDTGAGMDTGLLDRIFDPFFTTKGVGEGTGLGLSVVHGIVKGYEGEVIVTSEQGKGTTFDIYLPAIEDRDQNCDTERHAHVGAQSTHTAADSR